jgi:hypothetical protein
MLILSAYNAWPQQDPAPAGGQLSDKEKEEFLRNAKIGKMVGIKTGTTGTRQATLSNGRMTHDAHIQTIDRFENEFRTPSGLELNFRDSYKFNIAAYRLDRLIHLNLLPVTIERKVQGKSASVAWWVDDVQMMEAERYTQKIQPPNRADWNDQMYNVRLFNELVYNADPNMGNYLVTNDWKVRPVDFSRAFRTSKDLRKPENLKRIDRRVYDGLKALNEETVKRELGDCLRDSEIKGLMARRDRILEFFDEAIAKKGEGLVICSRPGH